jgi:hypothetical protein
MRHMPGYDSVVCACWGEGEGGQPCERVREKVLIRREVPYRARAGERHWSTDLRSSRNPGRCPGWLELEVRYRRCWCGRPEGSDIPGLRHLQMVQNIVSFVNK